MYVNKWFNTISQESSKLKLYSNFKNNVFLEEYLNDIKNIKYRQALSKIRIIAHSLQIEREDIVDQSYQENKEFVNFVQKMHVMIKFTF